MLIFGCNSSSKSTDTSYSSDTLSEHLGYVIAQNMNLIAQVERLEKEVDSLRSLTSQGSEYGKPFAFIVMEVVQDGEYSNNQGGQRVNYYRCSDVLNVGILDSETKYKLLDKFQQNYMSSPEGKVYHGSVNSREIFTFSTYEDASIAREKYIINK